MIDLEPGDELALGTDGTRTRLTLGLGWDKARNAGALGTGLPDVDLDASVVQFSGSQLFDLAFYNNLATRDGSVVHAGDNRSGAGEGDDETISVDLAKVWHSVDTLFVLVTSYQGHSLEWINRAYCRLVDADAGEEFGQVHLTGGVPETGLAVARLRRTDRGWVLRALGQGVAATQPARAVNALARLL
ncbi:MAG: Tellurium resistance protein terZ [Nocardioides sp.]|nr:Tellurium resistance protein terZ [Nocardioides sp.]